MLVASQLGEHGTDLLRRRVPDVDFITIPRAIPSDLPMDARMLIAVPAVEQGVGFPPRPDGWPFGLKNIQLISVGLDLYPDWYFDGLRVLGARGLGSDAIAEYVLALIFAAAKRLPEAWISRAEDWLPEERGMIAGSTLGIFGFGAIGQALALRAMAMGMKVLAMRRTPSHLEDIGVEQVADIGELFARSDYVVLAAPSTPETTGIVGADVLAMAKSGLHLVNVARGALIDDDALLHALDRGQIALASLDVTHPEPLPAGHPFYGHPRVRLSPHVAPRTTGTAAALFERVIENIHRLQRNEPLLGQVDLARGY
jgi:phosphoglycerate dehydrogenase-like enzyme